MKVITNNKPRRIVYGFELSETERKEFDCLSEEELRDRTFVKYKRQVYDLGDVMAFRHGVDFLPPEFNGWQGYVGDSYFSGVVFRYPDNDCETVIVGRYIS
jgi:hypothetical protein